MSSRHLTSRESGCGESPERERGVTHSLINQNKFTKDIMKCVIYWYQFPLFRLQLIFKNTYILITLLNGIFSQLAKLYEIILKSFRIIKSKNILYQVNLSFQFHDQFKEIINTKHQILWNKEKTNPT